MKNEIERQEKREGGLNQNDFESKIIASTGDDLTTWPQGYRGNGRGWLQGVAAGVKVWFFLERREKAWA